MYMAIPFTITPPPPPPPTTTTTTPEPVSPSDSCPEDPDNVHERARHYALMALTPAILLVNGAVLCLLLAHRHRCRPDVQLMTSLCCADLMVGFTCIATLVTQARERPLELCLLRVGLSVTAVMASILSLLAVAGDRLLAIVTALHYHRLVTPVRTRGVIVLLWALAAVFGLLPLCGWNRGEEVYVGYCSFLLVFPPSYVAASFGLSVLSLGAVLCIHAYLYLRARVHIRRIDALERVQGHRSSSSSLDGPLGLSGRSWKSVRTVTLVAGCVLACWCPFLLTSLYVLIAPRAPCVLNDIVGTHLLMLGYANSALNPLVYALRNRELRAVAARAWARVRRKPS
ncbi:glucose-dependent insulinotropic receptor-like [Babylonia areolata]|uniref:glucose-dependent insulinotropic receptor-like n=1 Tax=Babylonia areolata TaxID=304850 RepID=UPI003FD101FC